MKNVVEELKRILEEREGDRYEVSITEVVKRNDVIRKSLCVRMKGGSIGANLYEDDLERKREALNGDLEKLADYVTEVIRKNLDDSEFPDKVKKDLEGLRDYSVAKDLVLCHLVSKKGNEEYLRNLVSIPFLDLAICFYFIVGSDREQGKLSVTKELFNGWNVSTSELLERARANTQARLPHCIVSMYDFLVSVMGTDPFGKFMNEPEPPEECGCMYVLTNAEKMLGSAVILYPGLMKSVSEKIGFEEIAILPSSVHECILILKAAAPDADYLRGMVRETNESSVPPDEILSNSVYLYSAKTDEISIWED